MVVFCQKVNKSLCSLSVRDKNGELEAQKRQSACPPECGGRERRERYPGVRKGHR